jgi:hypothetical protein
MDLVAVLHFHPDSEFYEALYGPTMRMQKSSHRECRNEPVSQVLVAVDQPVDVQEFRTLAGSKDLRVLRKARL